MLGQHIATILAQTDPFDLAQGIERYVRSLTGDQVRSVLGAARPLMNEGYRAEFVPLLAETDDDRLTRGFIQTLRSNLRALPLFGPAFCEGVIAQVPGDRAVAMGEEGRSPVRPLAFCAIALVLLAAGAAGEHVWSAARATASTPVVLVTPPPTVAPGAPRAAAAKPIASPRRIAVAARVETPPPQTPAAATAPPPTAAATEAPPLPAAAPPVTAEPARSPVRVARRTPPAGAGVKTIVAAPQTPQPTPEPTDVDVSDMPQAFSDATPLPNGETAPPAQVPGRVTVATPTPAPNRSWTHRLIHTGVNLVDGTLKVIGVSKKGTPAPTPSPKGPQP